MSKIEQAKKLLKRAIELDDPELIKLANSILSEESQKSSSVKSTGEEFISTITAPDTDISKGAQGVPVNEVKNRVNQFIDDGTEDTDVTTPSVDPVPRRKPVATIQQQCRSCGETVTTSPTHQRDFYTCDKCLRNRRP